jgi:hypothetical protein
MAQAARARKGKRGKVSNAEFIINLAMQMGVQPYELVTNQPQPRHPSSQQYQGRPHNAAQRGYKDTGGNPQYGGPSRKPKFEPAEDELEEQDAAAELVGEDNPEGFDGRQVATPTKKGTEGDAALPSGDFDPSEHERAPMHLYNSEGEPVENMDPHNASREAAGASVMAEHGPSREHALTALDHSGNGYGDNAADSHIDAAKSHDKAAKKFRKDGDEASAQEHENAAMLHRRAASCHATTMNIESDPSNPEGDSMYDFTLNDSPPGHLEGADRSQVQAAFASDNPPGGKGGGGKNKASKSSTERDPSGKANAASAHAERTKSKGAHMKAAAAHESAAEFHEDEGNTKMQHAHENKAAMHRAAAKKLTRNARIRFLDELLVNCQDPYTISVLNAKKKEAEEDDDDEDDDEDEERNAGSYPAQASGGGKGEQAGGAGTKGEYELSGNRRLSAEDQEFLNYGKQQMTQNKYALVTRLIANVQDPRRRNIVGNKLMNESMGQLQERLELMPVVSNRQQTPPPQDQFTFNDSGFPMFPGAQGTSNTLNRDSASDDLLEAPTINWREWAEEDKKAGRR